MHFGASANANAVATLGQRRHGRAVLPPETLARTVVMSCELDNDEKDEKEREPSVEPKQTAREIVQAVRLKLPNATGTYTEQHPWTQRRVPSLAPRAVNAMRFLLYP